MKRRVPLLIVLGLVLFGRAAMADWTPIQRLTWNSGSSAPPAIAVDSSGHLHLVWCDGTPGNDEIYYMKSTDGGSTWMTSQRLTWNSGRSGYPAIAVDSFGHIHVVWEDDTPGNVEVYYRKSTDGGEAWTASERITWNSGRSECPAVAADSSGDTLVVWHDNTPGNNEVYCRKSTGGGLAWMAVKRLSWNSGYSTNPAVAIDSSGHLHIFWGDEKPGNKELYYTKSTNGGAAWASNQRITWTSGWSGYPQIAVDSSGHLHLVWYDDTPGGIPDIYYKESTNGGSAWLTSQRITWNSGLSREPVIAVDATGNPHVAWYDNTPGNYEVYYRESADGGSSWPPSQRLTWNSGWSGVPAIAVDPSANIHVVWSNVSTGFAEIYYRKYIN
jgi:hypothetical protein